MFLKSTFRVVRIHSHLSSCLHQPTLFVQHGTTQLLLRAVRMPPTLQVPDRRQPWCSDQGVQRAGRVGPELRQAGRLSWRCCKADVPHQCHQGDNEGDPHSSTGQQVSTIGSLWGSCGSRHQFQDCHQAGVELARMRDTGSLATTGHRLSTRTRNH